MRTRTRIHPYVLPNISQRLAAYCGAKGLTESAAVEAAIEQYLDGSERDSALILRRLDRLARDSAEQRRTLEVLSEAFAMYVRFWFVYMPQWSEAEQTAGIRRAGPEFERFIGIVSDAMARGPRLAGRVLKDEAKGSTAQQSRPDRPVQGNTR
jgi:hypothetical protein